MGSSHNRTLYTSVRLLLLLLCLHLPHFAFNAKQLIAPTYRPYLGKCSISSQMTPFRSGSNCDLQLTLRRERNISVRRKTDCTDFSALRIVSAFWNVSRSDCVLFRTEWAVLPVTPTKHGTLGATQWLLPGSPRATNYKNKRLEIKERKRQIDLRPVQWRINPLKCSGVRQLHSTLWRAEINRLHFAIQV